MPLTTQRKQESDNYQIENEIIDPDQRDTGKTINHKE